MSSFNNLKGGPLEFNNDFVAEQGVVTLYGSIQGNGTSAPAQTQFRGNWFTASRIAAGQYRIQLVGLNINNSLVATQSQGNGQPNGLLAEANAWVVSEVLQTAPSKLNAFCSKFDVSTNYAQTFDIFTFNQSGTATDTATTDRLFFELSWKVVSNLP